MSDGLYVAMSGAVAQQRAMDVVANNVANANTQGFRAERVTFEEVLNQKDELSFVSAERGAIDGTVGGMVSTENPLDLAIDGQGWFGLQTPDGTRYTRNGAFSVGPDGALVDALGNTVRSVGGNEILVPPDAAEISVDPAGQVLVDGQPLAQIEVVRFEPDQMRREGGNLFSATGKGDPTEPAGVVSGHLEGSNFNAVRGMVDLIRISRTHESLHRMIENYRQIDQRAAREIGGPA